MVTAIKYDGVFCSDLRFRKTPHASRSLVGTITPWPMKGRELQQNSDFQMFLELKNLTSEVHAFFVQIAIPISILHF